MAATEPAQAYPVGVAGFVAGFAVELVFERTRGGEGFECVGVEARCELCGRHFGCYSDAADLLTRCFAHANHHRPPVVDELAGRPTLSPGALEGLGYGYRRARSSEGI